MDKCYRCGSKGEGQFCPVCGDDLHEQAREQSEPSTRGFYIEVGDVIAHVQGDPDMDEEAIEALVKMIRAARRKFDDFESGEDKGNG